MGHEGVSSLDTPLPVSGRRRAGPRNGRITPLIATPSSARVLPRHGDTLILLDTPTTIDPTEDATPPDVAALTAAADEILAAADVAAVVPSPKPAAAAEDAQADDASLEIEDGIRLYLREIARVPLLTAEEEVVLAKSIELGRQIVSVPAKAILSLREWTLHETEARTRTSKTQHALPYGNEAQRLVADALRDEAALDLLVPAPSFGLRKAAKAAEGEAVELLDRAEELRVAYDAALDVGAFLELLDWTHYTMGRRQSHRSSTLSCESWPENRSRQRAPVP